MSSSLIYILTQNTQKKVSNIASDEDIMENNHVCYVMEYKHN